MPKTLKKRGKNTSVAEVQNISKNGIWVLIDSQEFFLSFDRFPWFKKAPVEDICTLELHHKNHLHWPTLDIDLSVESLKNPSSHPLIYR